MIVRRNSLWPHLTLDNIKAFPLTVLRSWGCNSVQQYFSHKLHQWFPLWPKQCPTCLLTVVVNDKLVDWNGRLQDKKVYFMKNRSRIWAGWRGRHQQRLRRRFPADRACRSPTSKSSKRFCKDTKSSQTATVGLNNSSHFHSNHDIKKQDFQITELLVMWHVSWEMQLYLPRGWVRKMFLNMSVCRVGSRKVGGSWATTIVRAPFSEVWGAPKIITVRHEKQNKFNQIQSVI